MLCRFLLVFLIGCLCVVNARRWRNVWMDLILYMSICKDNSNSNYLNLTSAVESATAVFAPHIRHSILPLKTCVDECDGILCGKVQFSSSVSSPALTTTFYRDGRLVFVNIDIQPDVAKTQQTLHAIMVHEFLHVYGLQHALVDDPTEDSMANYYLTRDVDNKNFYQELDFLTLTTFDIRDLWSFDLPPLHLKVPRSVAEQRTTSCTAIY